MLASCKGETLDNLPASKEKAAILPKQLISSQGSDLTN